MMKTADTATRYRPSPDVRRMRLGQRSVFFSERDQRLFELNPTADIIWGALEGSTPRAAHKALLAAGAEETQAQAYVADLLHAWLDAGHWMPCRRPLSSAPASTRMAFDGARIEISCSNARVLRSLASVLGPFQGFSGAAGARIHVETWAAGGDIFLNGALHTRAAENEIAPVVKALVTEVLVNTPSAGFFAHGALLARGGRTVMLSGTPGAGKSTLALALAQDGFACSADDVVKVDGTARFRGVPFAPALKTGAWPLLSSRLDDLETWPVHRRPDGQDVRYAPGIVGRAPGRPLDLFLRLARRPGSTAKAPALDPLEALFILLSEAYAANRRLSADLMQRLAQRFPDVDCRWLIYGELDEAVSTIGKLVDDL